MALVSTSAFANNRAVLFKTCSNPLIVEGELKIYLSQSNRQAKVTLSDLVSYPTKIVSLGPVQTFDYKTSIGIERIITAVDGGHELHIFDTHSRQFKKVGDLNCY